MVILVYPKEANDKLIEIYLFLSITFFKLNFESLGYFFYRRAIKRIRKNVRENMMRKTVEEIKEVGK